MTREEQIIAEAKKYYSGNIQCYDAFLHGVQFAEEHPINVWHDKEEEPEKENLLVLYDGCDFEVCYWPSLNHTWQSFVDWHFVRKWTYITDPDEEDEL